MERIVTTCGWCGKEIGVFTKQKVNIGDTIKILHPFCNPTCEAKGWRYDNPDGLSVVMGANGFVSEQHLIRQQIISNAPDWFVNN